MWDGWRRLWHAIAYAVMTEAIEAGEGEAAVVEWIAANIGPVVRISRQGRWRPAWFVLAERDGVRLELYVRGARGASFPPMPLSYEAEVLAVFAEEGIRVPKVFGFIPAIPAIVMERVPGRPNIATAESDVIRGQLRKQLADEMRKIHAIAPQRLETIGAPNSDDRREAGLLPYRAIEQLYLNGDRLPSPDVEFVRRWIDRNIPDCEEGPAVITVDAGQFLFDGDRLTGMVDLELACIGDRHIDMAALRTRDRIEEIGDLEEFYDLYHQMGGIKLDRDRIAFHWVTFAMMVPLQIAHDLAHPKGNAQYHEYLGWHARAMDDTLKDIARIIRIELPDYALPPAAPGRAGMLLEAMISVVDDMLATDDYQHYRRQDLSLALKYAMDTSARQTSLEQEYLDELEGLTGVRPRSAWEGDVQLCQFLETAGPELDGPILSILYRRNLRVNLILRMHSLRRREGKEQE